MGSPGSQFGRDMLVPPFHVFGPGCGGEPVWGRGTGPSQHAVPDQPSLQALFPKLYASLGPHFSPPNQISVWILQTGEKHCPASLVALRGGEGSARARGTFTKT